MGDAGRRGGARGAAWGGGPVPRARRYTDDVEFSAEDASRSDLEFLCRVVEAAIQEGATTVNLPDTVGDRKSTRLNSSHGYISYAVFCLKKKKLLASLAPRGTSPGVTAPS